MDYRATPKNQRIIANKKKVQRENNESLPFVLSNQDKQLSPWSFEENFRYESGQSRAQSKSSKARQKSTKMIRKLIEISGEPQTKMGDEFLDLLKKEKCKHNKNSLGNRYNLINMAKLNQISLQLDQELIHGSSLLFQDNRGFSRFQTRKSKRQEPTRVRILKKINQKRERQNSVKEDELFKDHKFIRYHRDQIQESYCPYQTISLELNKDATSKHHREKQKQYFHLTVRKLKKIPNHPNIKLSEQNGNHRSLQCRGQICANIDKHGLRKHKIKNYIKDNLKQSETIFLQ